MDSFPKRSEIIRFLREAKNGVGKREISQAFEIPGSSRPTLRKLLSDMENEGAIIRLQNRRYAVPKGIPPVGIVEVYRIDENGDLLGRPVGWKADNQNVRIFVVPPPKRFRQQALTIGQRILARLKKTDRTEIEARIMRVLHERTGTIIGVVEKQDTYTEIKSIDKRNTQSINIKDISEHDLKDGDIVQARLEGKKIYGQPQAVIEKLLGKMYKPGAIEIIVCSDHDIPTEFSQESTEEALAAGPPDPKGREDLTSLPFVTIDDEDARDFDDAIWAEPDTSKDNPGGWKLITAIADVSHYVKPHSALDRDAQTRGNSVYLPSKVVPMLPEALSTEWCSLKPNENRACLAARIRLSKVGEIKDYNFVRGIIRSVARLTYAEVEAHHTGNQTHKTTPVGPQIANLYGAYAVLRQARAARKTLDFDLPETKIVFDHSGKIITIEPRPHYDSHRLIEEFMITANIAAAETLTTGKTPCLYRIHDQPPLDKSETLRGYLKDLGYKLSRTRQLRPQHFQQILEKAKGTQNEEAISLMILRSQSQAEYSPKNIGHFGLNIVRYSHFTSPIRRYSDLLVHRSLITQLNLGDDGVPSTGPQELSEIGIHLSKTERRAANAERSAVERYKTSFIADKVGATFSAKVSSVTRFGLFIVLDESGAEGLLPIRLLGQQLKERVHYGSRSQTLVARRAGVNFRLGDRISVRLETADKITGGLSFTLSDFDSPDVSAQRRQTYRRRYPRT